MIIIKLKGGLGNQLFQYAYGRLLSIKNNVPVTFEFEGNKNDTAREYKLDKFNTNVKFPSEEEKNKLKGNNLFIKKLKNKIFKNYNIGYNASALHKKSGYLEGFWQSYKYLEPIKDSLLKEITLREPLIESNNEILKQIEGTDSVFVQIRRGDYVNDSKTKSEHYTFGLEYYQEAFSLIKEKLKNPTLFIFSDDILWCKNNIKSEIPMVFSEPSIPDYENFIIGSKCKHDIISNSSFGFWIAWLNQNPNKIIIAPKKWNNVYQKEYADLLPENWIKI